MKKFKALVITLACAAALSISAAALTIGSPQNSNQGTGTCCEDSNCCKADMSCCKARTKKKKNAHACCKGMDKKESCCCGKAGECPMPNKAAPKNQNGN